MAATVDQLDAHFGHALQAAAVLARGDLREELLDLARGAGDEGGARVHNRRAGAARALLAQVQRPAVHNDVLQLQVPLGGPLDAVPVQGAARRHVVRLDAAKGHAAAPVRVLREVDAHDIARQGLCSLQLVKHGAAVHRGSQAEDPVEGQDAEGVVGLRGGPAEGLVRHVQVSALLPVAAGVVVAVAEGQRVAAALVLHLARAVVDHARAPAVLAARGPSTGSVAKPVVLAAGGALALGAWDPSDAAPRVEDRRETLLWVPQREVAVVLGVVVVQQVHAYHAGACEPLELMVQGRLRCRDSSAAGAGGVLRRMAICISVAVVRMSINLLQKVGHRAQASEPVGQVMAAHRSCHATCRGWDR
mmetsp:Transcript_94860/g.277348  ORF Transcript_94860/g.277348 Transcript_94860/m.277348 type:complete len:361 (+) Transcript_94860:456-1538(+)